MTTAPVETVRENTPTGALRLLLGGRTTRIPGFTNVDLFDGEGVDVKADVSDLSMFKDKSVSEIYCSHVLEHFSHTRTQYVLEEWHRVLVPRGTLYVSVPDFDACVRLYQQYGMTDFIRNFMYGDQEYDLAYHYTIFTYPILAALCVKAGFDDVSRIEKMPYGIKDCSGNLDSFTKKPLSVNVKVIA